MSISIDSGLSEIVTVGVKGKQKCNKIVEKKITVPAYNALPMFVDRV